jgi:glucose/arabinose dehydrogenase
LRNALALAVHPRTGLVLMADNGIDLPDAGVPPEELNVVVKGGHYGWPYCSGAGFRTPDVKGVPRCSRFKAPAVSIPAHAAPLGLLNYQGAMFPDLRGRWLVALHGYRSTGHRIVAYTAARGGQPRAGTPSPVLGGWDKVSGKRPQGAPVGMGVAADGSLWVVEDRNRTIVVLCAEAAGRRPKTGVCR